MSTIVPSGIGSFAGAAGASRSWANGPAKSILGSIRHALTAGVQDLAFHWVQDSTGDETAELPYVFANTLGAQFPERNIKQRFWNSGSDVWYGWTTTQTSYLGERFRDFTWAASNNTGILWPSGEIGTFTGPDFTIIAKIQIPTTITDNPTICAQYQTSGNKRKFWFYIKSDNKMAIRISENGTAEQVFVETNALTGLAGTDQWVKVVFDADNGAGASACTFYLGNSTGTSWTQRSTHAGTVISTLYDTTDVPFEVGSMRGTDDDPAALSTATSKIYSVEVWDDTTGSLVNPVLTAMGRTISYTDRGKNYAGGGPEIQNWIAAISGATYDRFMDATRFPKIHPKIGSSGVMFVCLGHNERDYGYTLWSRLDTYLTQYRARCPLGNICFVGQNPRTPPARVGHSDLATAKLARTSFDMVQQVNFDTAAWCAKNNIGYIDLHTPFFDHPNNHIFVNADGIHPLPAGSEARAALLFDQLMRA